MVMLAGMNNQQVYTEVNSDHLLPKHTYNRLLSTETIRRLGRLPTGGQMRRAAGRA
jgi:hypothetical protein